MAEEDTIMTEGSGASEEFHEVAEGFHDLGEGTSGRLTIPGSPRLPSGQVLLRDAIRSFCSCREGKPADNIDLQRFQELIDPIRTTLLDGRIKVTCIKRDGGRTTVSGDAFVDEKTWWAIVYAPGSVPIRPKVGIEDGHLVVVQAEFDTVTLEQVDCASGPSLGTSTASAAEIPKFLRFALELADRFDLTEDYNFDKKAMRLAILKVAAEEEWERLKISPDRAWHIARLLGDPQFAEAGAGRKRRKAATLSAPYAPATPSRNYGRPDDPAEPFNGITYMTAKRDR